MTPFYDLPRPGKDALSRSQALSDDIRLAIHQQGGCLSFSTFMELALYHSRWGYYQSPAFQLGKQGDFITAPEISPLFARAFACQYLDLSERLGTLPILELGAGSGRFASDLLLELNLQDKLPPQYYIYEISAHLRKKQHEFLQATCPHFIHRIHWLHALPSEFSGLIIANEVLDALPVHCFKVTEEGIKERCVTTHLNDFAWQLCPPSSDEFAEKAHYLSQQHDLWIGYESELHLPMHHFVKKVARSLKQGVILFVDYGYGQAEYYHPERYQGSLTCFYQHRHHNNPLIYPGLQDISVHVDFSAVIEHAAEAGCTLLGYTTQASFLFACGLMKLAEEEEKNCSPADAFKLHQAIKILTLPTEMGERIKVMAIGKEVEIDLLGFGLQDRCRDL